MFDADVEEEEEEERCSLLLSNQISERKKSHLYSVERERERRREKD